MRFRARGGLRSRLEAAAADSGRSVSEEIEHRLDRSFDADDFEAEFTGMEGHFSRRARLDQMRRSVEEAAKATEAAWKATREAVKAAEEAKKAAADKVAGDVINKIPSDGDKQ